jgi:hypothetical protein
MTRINFEHEAYRGKLSTMGDVSVDKLYGCRFCP